jgi:hypothetical protein
VEQPNSVAYYYNRYGKKDWMVFIPFNSQGRGDIDQRDVRKQSRGMVHPSHNTAGDNASERQAVSGHDNYATAIVLREAIGPEVGYDALRCVHCWDRRVARTGGINLLTETDYFSNGIQVDYAR